MDSTKEESQHEAKGKSDKRLITKIYALGGIIILLTYGKIVWPMIFGRMSEEGISFWEAAKDSSVHSMALGLLVLALIVGFAWAWSRTENNEHE